MSKNQGDRRQEIADPPTGGQETGKSKSQTGGKHQVPEDRKIKISFQLEKPLSPLDRIPCGNGGSL